jgi:hypothetical protein
MTIELGKKKYTVDGVPVRALDQMDEAWDVYRKLVKAAAGQDAGDAGFHQVITPLANWLVVLFCNQFTVDEVLDGYPADRFIADVGLMLQGVAGHATEALAAFPTRARPTTEKQKNRIATLLTKFMQRIWTQAGHRKK